METTIAKPTTPATKHTSMKAILIAAMLLVLAIVFWKWTMVRMYANHTLMPNHGRMERAIPMNDMQLKQEVDASAATDAEADLKIIDGEFN